MRISITISVCTELFSNAAQPTRCLRAVNTATPLSVGIGNDSNDVGGEMVNQYRVLLLA